MVMKLIRIKQTSNNRDRRPFRTLMCTALFTICGPKWDECGFVIDENNFRLEIISGAGTGLKNNCDEYFFRLNGSQHHARIVKWCSTKE